jgi:hypothetical protein
MDNKPSRVRNGQKDEERRNQHRENQAPDQESADFNTPIVPFPDWARIPKNGAAIPLQQKAILQMQRRSGNQQVQHQIDKVIQRQEETEEETAIAVAPVAPVSGQGESTERVAYSLTLEGRTDASFDGGTFSTQNVRTTAGEDCPGCEGAECVHVTGVVVSRFHVTTAVTLPSVDDFPDLTTCQRQRVQAAITNVLAPHEQEHVQAFRQYNGVVRTPFDLNICRADFDAEIQSIHDGVEAPRQSSAQTASDDLDPFNFTVDLDCEEEESATVGWNSIGSENPMENLA